MSADGFKVRHISITSFDDADGISYPRYANVEYLSQYIPRADPKHALSQTLRIRSKKRTTILYTQSTIVALTALANLGFTCWALSKHHSVSGIGTFYIGNCDVTARLDVYVHLILNVISSLCLGAGNYCMQIILAPSRDEAVAAHQKGETLDIGISSLRNLKYIKRGKGLVWILFALMSASLHLLYVVTCAYV